MNIKNRELRKAVNHRKLKLKQSLIKKANADNTIAKILILTIKHSENCIHKTLPLVEQLLAHTRVRQKGMDSLYKIVQTTQLSYMVEALEEAIELNEKWSEHFPIIEKILLGNRNAHAVFSLEELNGYIKEASKKERFILGQYPWQEWQGLQPLIMRALKNLVSIKNSQPVYAPNPANPYKSRNLQRYKWEWLDPKSEEFIVPHIAHHIEYLIGNMHKLSIKDDIYSQKEWIEKQEALSEFIANFKYGSIVKNWAKYYIKRKKRG